jgi:hypothetical protein
MPSHISFEVADMNRQDEKGADQSGVVISGYVEVMAYDRVLESLKECSQGESCRASYGNKPSATIPCNTFKSISPGMAHRSFWQSLKLEVGGEHGERGCRQVALAGFGSTQGLGAGGDG